MVLGPSYSSYPAPRYSTIPTCSPGAGYRWRLPRQLTASYNGRAPFNPTCRHSSRRVTSTYPIWGSGSIWDTNLVLTAQQDEALLISIVIRRRTPENQFERLSPPKSSCGVVLGAVHDQTSRADARFQQGGHPAGRTGNWCRTADKLAPKPRSAKYRPRFSVFGKRSFQ